MIQKSKLIQTEYRNSLSLYIVVHLLINKMWLKIVCGIWRVDCIFRDIWKFEFVNFFLGAYCGCFYRFLCRPRMANNGNNIMQKNPRKNRRHNILINSLTNLSRFDHPSIKKPYIGIICSYSKKFTSQRVDGQAFGFRVLGERTVEVHQNVALFSIAAQVNLPNKNKNNPAYSWII